MFEKIWFGIPILIQEGLPDGREVLHSINLQIHSSKAKLWEIYFLGQRSMCATSELHGFFKGCQKDRDYEVDNDK
jgi:hypothetical protein